MRLANHEAEIACRAAEIKKHHAESVVCFEAYPSVETLIYYEAIHRAGKVAMPLPVDCPKSQLEMVDKLLSTNPTIPANAADVLYTTGSTAQPKAVVISRQAIAESSHNLMLGQGYNPNLRTLLIGPLNHIGTLSKYWAATNAGGAVEIVADAIKNPDLLFRAIHQSKEPVALFLVPTQLQILLQLAPDLLRRYASHIHILETGAAPISRTTMMQLSELMPQTPLYNTYASTETGIIATHRYNVLPDAEHPDTGYCQPGLLGCPLGKGKISIDPADNHLIIQSPTIMSGYLGDEYATNNVLSSFQTIHTTDTGILDNQGRLQLTGRLTDIINTGGFKTSPQTIENAAMQLNQVSEALCIPISHPLLGQVPHLIVAHKPDVSLTKNEVIRLLRPLLEFHQLPQRITITDAIQHLPNGKPDRLFYKRR